MKYSIYENGGAVEGQVSINGLIMSGKLKLQRTAEEPNEAVNKQFVDDKVTNLDASKITSGTMPVERFPALTGDLVSVAGTGVITLKNTGVTPGTYTKVTVNGSGLVTMGSNLTEEDIPPFGWEKITSGKPTTLAGYGITNAVNRNGGTVNGNILLTNTPVNPNDVVTKAYADTVLSGRVGFAVGDIVSYGSDTVPSGFLRCNGGEVSKTTYAALYAVIGDQFGGDVMPGAGQPWCQQYAFNNQQSNPIGAWNTGSGFYGSVGGHQIVVTKNRVYAIGGYGEGVTYSYVYYAPINSDGTLGAWVAAANLPMAIGHTQVVVTKNRVYVLGGYHNSGSNVGLTYYAPINSDGSLGAWVAGPNLPTALGDSQAIVTKNRVYLMGGAISYNTASDVIYSATIDSNGAIGTWTAAGTIAEAMRHHSCAVTKNRVYLIGGGNSLGTRPTVQSAPINPDGTLGTWSKLSDFPVNIVFATCIVTKTRVFVIGGSNGGPAVSAIYTAPINADGSLGAWVLSPNTLPSGLSYSKAIITNSRIHLLGGYVGSYTSVTYTASFSGGDNDYSIYYDGTIMTAVNSNNFRLPDYTNNVNPNGSYIIKF